MLSLVHSHSTWLKCNSAQGIFEREKKEKELLILSKKVNRPGKTLNRATESAGKRGTKTVRHTPGAAQAMGPDVPPCSRVVLILPLNSWPESGYRYSAAAPERKRGVRTSRDPNDRQSSESASRHVVTVTVFLKSRLRTKI